MIKTTALLAVLALSASSIAFAQQAETRPAQDEEGSLDDVLSAREQDRRPAPQSRERQAPTSRPGTVAILRGLDKVTARTRDFEAPVGETVAFGALDVTVRYCRKRPPEEPPEVFTFVQVADRRTDGFGVETEGERIFSGWMFASNPALNPLEHPVYDIWVMDCRA